MNNEKVRNTNNTPQKKMLTFMEIIAVALYLFGNITIALAIVTLTVATRFAIELKERKSNKDNNMALVVNGIILVAVVVVLFRSM